MKDSYSFDIDQAGLDVSFDAHRGAYERIFARLGIPAFGVEASNGTMGGSDSVEFMCPSKAGEDPWRPVPGLRLRGEPGEGDLGAAGDRLTRRLTRRPPRRARLDTPGVRTIEDLATGTAWPLTGRSRRWCRSSTASSRWCCCAATTRCPTRS